MQAWYVVQTKPRQENIAAENLHRQGYVCFNPRIQKWRKYRGKRRLCEEAYFPNYVFVELDLDHSNTAPIRSTKGVSKLVRFGNQLLPLPDALIQALQEHSDQNGVLKEPAKDFQPGQTVQIEEGPFAGIQAIFQAKTGEQRAILMLNILGTQQKIQLPLTALENVS